MQEIDLKACQVAVLGKPNIKFASNDNKLKTYINEANRILYHSHENELRQALQKQKELPSFELAGPREKIFFDPKKTKIGIVTCGGLCPGLNAIIRAIVYTSYNYYGITEVYGYCNGYQGLNPAYKHKPLKLTQENVDYIIDIGGTILGSSRGPQEEKVMVDYLVKENVNILFTVGGDGTLRGAHAIVEEIKRRKLNISVVGIPKTIDNDILVIERSFGFETAVEEAKNSIHCAHAEAKGTPNGVGLVKLMGRESGFIAAYSTLAAPVVNFCLIPEVKFELPKFLNALQKRLVKKGHAVIVVAEGAGQDLFAGEAEEKDLSGNTKLKDIGIFLKDNIKNYFKKQS
jgi:6-phosphofructokinase 1